MKIHQPLVEGVKPSLAVSSFLSFCPQIQGLIDITDSFRNGSFNQEEISTAVNILSWLLKVSALCCREKIFSLKTVSDWVSHI